MTTTEAHFSAARSALARLTARLAGIGRDAIGFGLVGLGGMVIDLVIFNALRLGMLGPALSLTSKPLTASVISAGFAIVFNWAGGRFWVFRSRRRADVLREFAEYVLVALLGLGIGLATLAFTHYTLGATSLVADNISKNVIGLALGTVTRFLLLRFWVWGRGRVGSAAVPEVLTVTASIPHLSAARDEAA